MNASAGHPWLEALKADPAREIRALIEGMAATTPYERAEPCDAAAMMFAARPDDQAAKAALDRGCGEVLEQLRGELRDSDQDDFDHAAFVAQKLLAVINRLRPAGVIADLHNRFLYWNDAFECARIDEGLDVLREYYRVLALTQSHDFNSRRLLPFWLDICAEAGKWGRFNETYLDVGFIGLRKLPIGGDIASNEEALCMGFAIWAAYQQPDKTTVQSRWWEIDSAYPRDPDFWPPLINRALASAKAKVNGEIPASDWWRNATGVDFDETTFVTNESGSSASGVLPALDEHEVVLKNIPQEFDKIEPGIRALVDKHRAYADQTGDTYYLVRTLCNVGKELLKNGIPTERRQRGELAVRLARIALDYQSTDAVSWALWRDGLDHAGAPSAARVVAWEACRRFPEDEIRNSQLGKLLRGHGLIQEAKRVLEWGIAAFPRHAHTYTQLAIILADDLNDRAGAIELLHKGAKACGTNGFFQALLDKAMAGRRLAKRPDAPTTADRDDMAVDFAAARAHRGLMMWRTAVNDDERDAALAQVREVLHSDPTLAYARYAALHTGAERIGADGGMFAFAFARALNSGDWGSLESAAGSSLRDKILARLACAIAAGEKPDITDKLPNTPAMDRLKVVIDGVSATIRPQREPALRWLASFAAGDMSAGMIQSA